MYLPNSSDPGKRDKVNCFKVEYSWFEIRVFFLLDKFFNQWVTSFISIGYKYYAKSALKTF